MDLFFNSDMVNPLLKTNGGRNRRPNFVILCGLGCFNGRRVVGGGFGGRKSRFGRDEISSLLFLVLFKDGTQGESRASFMGGLRSERWCDHKGRVTTRQKKSERL